MRPTTRYIIEFSRSLDRLGVRPRYVRQLLLSDETGPRLPTLFLSLGPERVRRLLTPSST